MGTSFSSLLVVIIVFAVLILLLLMKIAQSKMQFKLSNRSSLYRKNDKAASNFQTNNKFMFFSGLISNLSSLAILRSSSKDSQTKSQKIVNTMTNTTDTSKSDYKNNDSLNSIPKISPTQECNNLYNKGSLYNSLFYWIL